VYAGAFFHGGYMRKPFLKLNYFTKNELFLWASSVMLIVISFCVFDRANYLTLTASIIGATSLIFNAKGNPFGQFLMIIFSVLYGIISLSFAYYGEMITYLGMTAPMALFALVSWLRNPYNGNKAEVKVNRLSAGETVFMFILGRCYFCFLFYFTGI
jgi:nicotinamide mononucleotide transporter